MMNGKDMLSMIDGLSEPTKDIVVRKLNAQLINAVNNVNKSLIAEGLGRENVSPQPKLILNAFRLTEIDKVRVVLLGQDPYTNPSKAMGLSFSIPKGINIPSSLRKIYECLLNEGLIKEMPTHGDLTAWAKQGVLMFNTALTTSTNKSNAHANEWKPYTDDLIKEISLLPRSLMFILLGKPAQEKKSLIDTRRHIILEWGHPSTANRANTQPDNPKNFKYCNVFTRVNELLTLRGELPINWDPNGMVPAPAITLKQAREMIPNESLQFHENMRVKEDAAPTLNAVTILKPEPVKVVAIAPKYKLVEKPVYATREADNTDPVPLTTDTLWLFTDGGSRGNGKENCSASWAFYLTDGCKVSSGYGIVEEKVIPGEVFRASNNRGELTAMMKGLEFLSNNMDEFAFDKIILVSDSEYSINCLDKWAKAWFANPAKHKLSEKKNLDIIVPAKEMLDQIRTLTTLNFQHVRSHLDEPTDAESNEWFIWKCNDIVDVLCNKALGRC